MHVDIWIAIVVAAIGTYALRVACCCGLSVTLINTKRTTLKRVYLRG